MTPQPHAPSRATNAGSAASTRADRLARALVVVLVTIDVAFTLLVAGGSGSLEQLPNRVVYLVMAAVALIPWLTVAVIRPGWRPATRLAPAIIACLAALAISTAASREPRLSIEVLASAILLAELYLLLVALMRRPALRVHFERLALVLCVVVCVLYLAQAFGAWLTWWGAIGRLTIPPLRPGYLGLNLGSPNPVATLVLLLAAFGLATLRLRGASRRAVTTAVLALVAVTVLVTASRGAWLGAAAAIAVTFAVAVLARKEARAAALRRLRSRTMAVAAAAGLGLLAAAGVVAGLSGRLTLDDGGYRAGFSSASLRIFEASPLSGSGPGTWQILRAANSDPGAPDLYIPHAHSIYLQSLAELGLLGILAGLVLAASVGLLTWRSLRSDDPSRRRVAYAALFSIILLAVQQVGDLLVNVPALLLAMTLPIAWLDADALPPAGRSPARPGERARRGGAALPLVMVVVTGAVVIGLARMESVALTAAEGAAAANGGRWAEAASRLADAAAADPEFAAYQFQLGVAAANAGDLAAAERALAASTAADDYTYAWLDLAAVRWKLDDLQGARDALEHAERLGFQRAPVMIAAGWLRQHLGDDETAINHYATAITQYPSLADDPFWASPDGPPDGFASLLEEVEGRAAPATMLQVDLVLGRLERASAAAAILAATDPAVYPLVVPAWAGDSAAWAALQAEAGRRPLDPGPIAWARVIAAHLNDRDAVERYDRWLTGLNGGRPVMARIGLGSPQPLPPDTLDRYGSLYRRQVLRAQVVGILPQLVLQGLP